MRATRYTLTAVFFLILFQVSAPAFGQLGFSFNLKKPKEYEDQELPSEKTEEKKFTLMRRFFQNMTTHYNYYFNANNKLNEILDRAKAAHKDDYSQLLSFYNYSLDATIQDSLQLDSLTYKSSTAVALHDLRNDWIDNMYLLWGASYFLQKKFDSAYLMFQFINYAFSPKEKDGTLKTIGSPRDGNSAYSISTKEKNSLPRRVFTEPPSRNDAFIWQIRNFLAQDELADAASMIVTLKNDPNFPKRLQNDLHEVQAWWFYKQNIWDSAATHLVLALSNATNKQEEARWEYLAAQLFEMSGKYKEAEKYYARVSKHTTDPIMDIYARLFAVRVNKDGGEKSIEKNVAELLKMAKQDRYEEYRDIIYYMAGRMQLEGNNTDAAIPLLIKSTQFTSNDPAQRNRAFIDLADIAYTRKQYRSASSWLDSVNYSDPALKDPEILKAKKETLGKLAVNLDLIERQDSLRRIASLPEDERKEFVKKLVKELRKKQGLKDEGAGSSPSPFNTQAPTTLFPSNSTRGEWYFYNAEAKTRGFNEFKSKWGNNRPNVDNWRRATAIAGIVSVQTNQAGTSQPGIQGNTPELSFDRLYANLPLTGQQLKESDDSLQSAMFAAGKIFIQDLEDCNEGTQTFEQLRTRFPAFSPMDEVLFNLYYCYNKNGDAARAAAIKKLMSEKYDSSNFTTIILTGKNPKSKSGNPDATKAYEKIYDLFIEGNFSQALAEKKAADSLYGKSYWTPQLLYIESVYHIRQRDDSTAKTVLNDLVTQFPGTPMAARAASLIEVLDKRAQIEEELRNLVVTREKDDTPEPGANNVYWVNTTPPKDTASKTNPTVINPTKPIADTSAKKPIAGNSPYRYNPAEPHYVVLVLNKVDPVYVNETKNAFARYNKDNYYNKLFTASLADLDADNRLLLLSPFASADEAVAYITQAKPRTASEIIPWLKGGKYFYLILTDANYDLLKVNKDLEAYKAFLNQYFPGKF